MNRLRQNKHDATADSLCQHTSDELLHLEEVADCLVIPHEQHVFPVAEHVEGTGQAPDRSANMLSLNRNHCCRNLSFLPHQRKDNQLLRVVREVDAKISPIGGSDGLCASAGENK